MPRLDVGRITLDIEERGSGPAFIFIPGLVGLKDAWSLQMAEFSQRYHCIAFDHRGTGDSDKPASGYSTDEIARDVIALMDTLGIAEAHIAGTSTGGCVLQNIAIDYSDRLRCAIFSNTWVKADEFITRVQTARKQIALSYGPAEYVRVSSLFTNGPQQFRFNLDNVMELEKRALATVAPVDVLAQRLDMSVAHDREADLGRIRAPSLIVGTLDDATVPSYQSEDLHKAIPGSRLIIAPEGGHYAYRRHWQEWNKMVAAFLRDTEGGV